MPTYRVGAEVVFEVEVDIDSADAAKEAKRGIEELAQRGRIELSPFRDTTEVHAVSFTKIEVQALWEHTPA